MKKILVFLLFFSLLPGFVWAIDTDNDGLDDKQELFYYTDPNNPDTDGDGFLDGVEVEMDYTPHSGGGLRMHEYDYDGDGLNDWAERWFNTDLGKKDTDNDGYDDFSEVMFGYDPAKKVTLKKFDRYIEVDKTLQRLNFFVDRVKLLNLPVSTGNPESETPGGEFKIEKMIPSKSYIGPGYNLPGVVWNMQFISPLYYIHGAYWHNDFGIKTHSHGCVNLKDKDAEMLYNYVEVGLPVVVTGTTPSKYIIGS